MRLTVCIALLAGSGLALQAQTLSSLSTGTMIRVTTTQGVTLEGKLQNRTADSLWLKPEHLFAQPQVVARSYVFSVERREASTSDRIGSGLLGGVLGAAIGYLTYGNSNDAAVASNRGTIIGASAAGGFLAGVIFPMLRHWIQVPKD